MRNYKCFERKCEKNKRLAESELIKRNEDSKHIDYCCPDCGSVVICEVLE